MRNFRVLFMRMIPKKQMSLPQKPGTFMIKNIWTPTLAAIQNTASTKCLWYWKNQIFLYKTYLQEITLIHFQEISQIYLTIS